MNINLLIIDIILNYALYSQYNIGQKSNKLIMHIMKQGQTHESAPTYMIIALIFDYDFKANSNEI